MASVVWSRRAVADLQEIHDYIALDSDYHAERTIAALLSRPKRLPKHPESGRIVPEIGDKTIREIFEGQYRIIYSLKQLPDIEIVRVYHFARLLKNL